MTPRRIQRRRTPGWKMPEGAVYVGRPSRWGNPFRVERDGALLGEPLYRVVPIAGLFDRVFLGGQHDRRTAHAQAADLFALHVGPMGSYEYGDADLADLRADLAGRDLACWCPATDKAGRPMPCHADTLLEIANA